MKWFGFILIGAVFIFYLFCIVSLIKHRMKDELELKKLRTPCPECGSHDHILCMKKKDSCL